MIKLFYQRDNKKMKPDKYQLEAIECDKNLLLIAGAGAGKTYTITEKIKYLIEEKHLKENEILVISFTNKSVMIWVKE